MYSDTGRTVVRVYGAVKGANLLTSVLKASVPGYGNHRAVGMGSRTVAQRRASRLRQSLRCCGPCQGFLHPLRFFLHLRQEPIPVIRRMPAFQHLAKHPVGVVAAFVGAFGVFVIHPSVDNHLARGVVPEEQSVLLEELGPEPVLVIVTSRPTLAVLRSRRIVRDYIERQFGDRSQGRRVDPP